MGEIAAVWIKRFKRGPMDPAAERRAGCGTRDRGNANQGGRRQVTLIDEGRWREAQDEVGVDVPPSARRANVMLRGVDLERSNGRRLRLGECIVRIYGETRPCEQMEDAQAWAAERAASAMARGRVWGDPRRRYHPGRR